MAAMDRMAAKAAGALRPSSTDDVAQVGTPSDADATWAAMTIPHHRSGIALADLALERASGDGVREVAQKSKQDQEEDLPVLEQIVRAAGTAPIPPEGPLEALQEQNMARLSAASGEQFDALWLDVFRSHHMSAIMSTDVAAAASGSPVAHRLQQSVRTGQLAQIDRMNELSRSLQG